MKTPDYILDIEETLTNDADGSAKNQLIETLETQRSKFAESKNRGLPPNEFEHTVILEQAVGAAIDVVEHAVRTLNSEQKVLDSRSEMMNTTFC